MLIYRHSYIVSIIWGNLLRPKIYFINELIKLYIMGFI